MCYSFLYALSFLLLSSAPSAARPCPKRCSPCDTNANCQDCDTTLAEEKCERFPQVQKTESLCGDGCLKCCVWNQHEIFCMIHVNNSLGLERCPTSSSIRQDADDDAVHDDDASGNGDQDLNQSYVHDKPQGPIIGMFLLFCLFVFTVTMREHCRRRQLALNHSVERTYSFRPPPLRTAGPLTNTESSSISAQRTSGRVVVVMGPAGEVEVGVKEPLPSIATLPPIGPINRS